MSESAAPAPSAPAPAAAPAAPSPAASPPPSSPPASSQPKISPSEAARVLSLRRQEARQQAAAQVRADAAPSTPPPPAAAPETASPAADTHLDSMAKALGLQDGAGQPGPQALPEPAATPGLDIDGRRITADEVRRAMAASADYTKKTQALAEQQRVLAEQQQALATVLPYLQPELAAIQKRIEGVPPPDPALIETDHQAYLRHLAAWHAAQEEQNRLGQLHALQQQASDRALAEQVHRSNEALAQALPQWGDPSIRAEWQRRIAEWAMDRGGFQRAELSRLSDHRQVMTMMKAMMWDNMVSGAKTSAPQTTTPARGVAPPPPQSERVRLAEEAFKASPTSNNAIALVNARRGVGR